MGVAPPLDSARWHDLSVSLPEGGFQAVLSKRHGGFFDAPLEEHRAALALELGLSTGALAVPRQVHGNAVATGRAGHIHEQTDGLVTADSQVVLTLQVADCAPVYLAHEPSGTRGLVHAGWRGVSAGVLAQAVEAMERAGAVASEIAAFLGPCIEQSCYEVGPDVRRQFDADLAHANGQGRHQLDLRAAISRQLARAGIPRDHINVSAICTRCDLGSHSYRRDGAQAGRMIAFFYDRTAVA